MSPSAPVRTASVALPSEHGGWSLTLEPVLLGLLVLPSWSGAFLGMAALTAFLLRTPLKLATGDWRRRRSHPRTVLAVRWAVGYGLTLTGLVLAAAVTAPSPRWLMAVAVAAPLVVVQFSFDIRSRSRRLIPELAGTIGASAAAAAVVLAGGGSVTLALGLWLVSAGRAVAAIPFVRDQLSRAKGRDPALTATRLAQAAAVLAGGTGLVAGLVPLSALIALVVLATFHLVAIRRPVPTTAIIGAQQVVLGLTVVLATALGVLAP